MWSACAGHYLDVHFGDVGSCFLKCWPWGWPDSAFQQPLPGSRAGPDARFLKQPLSCSCTGLTPLPQTPSTSLLAFSTLSDRYTLPHRRLDVLRKESPEGPQTMGQQAHGQVGPRDRGAGGALQPFPPQPSSPCHQLRPGLTLAGRGIGFTEKPTAPEERPRDASSAPRGPTTPAAPAWSAHQGAETTNTAQGSSQGRKERSE